MKSAISIIIVLCILVVVPVLLFGDLEMLKSFGIDTDSSFWARAKAPKNVTSVTTDQKVTVYKWRDEHGVLQFTSMPPETLPAEEVVLKPNTNIVKAVEVPEEEPEEASSGSGVMKIGPGSVPDAVKDLLGATADGTEKLDQRQDQQEKLMNQLTGKK